MTFGNQLFLYLSVISSVILNRDTNGSINLPATGQTNINFANNYHLEILCKNLIVFYQVKHFNVTCWQCLTDIRTCTQSRAQFLSLLQTLV